MILTYIFFRNLYTHTQIRFYYIKCDGYSAYADRAKLYQIKK